MTGYLKIRYLLFHLLVPWFMSARTEFKNGSWRHESGSSNGKFILPVGQESRRGQEFKNGSWRHEPRQ